MTIIPAYGRDYTSKAMVIAAWEKGLDFVIADMSNPHDGRKINRKDATKDGIRLLTVRYQNLTKVAIIHNEV